MTKTKHSTEVLAWWFSVSDRLPNSDGRKVVIGETLRVEPPIVPCQRGLHASIEPFDALKYAPGPLIYRVRLSGEIVAGGDKHAASERTALAVRDASEMLRAFARAQALSVAHLWEAPDVVRGYLETGDETLRADAHDAALDAANASAEAAASAGSCAATRAANATAMAAARSGPRGAAIDAWNVAMAAARSAPWDVPWDDTWDADAWDAARDAARAPARAHFKEIVEQLFASDL